MKRLSLFIFLTLSFSYQLKASSINHINIVVSELNQAAKLFAQHGFVLKKPHIYKSGLQRGLVAQSIHFKSGQYIQLMSLDKAQKSRYGALALWYQAYLKKSSQAQGLAVVIETSELKKLSKTLLTKSIPNRIKDFSTHEWLSFKTNSPYQHLSFISLKKQIPRDKALYAHNSGVTELVKVSVNFTGDPAIWSTILQAADSISIGLEFSSLTYQSTGIIQRIGLKSLLNPCPDPFRLGLVEFTFLCPVLKDKAGL